MGEFIGNIINDTEYVDDGTFGDDVGWGLGYDTEYCYVVVAVYDEGEASASNEDCATSSSPPNPVELSVDDLSIILYYY